MKRVLVPVLVAVLAACSTHPPSSGARDGGVATTTSTGGAADTTSRSGGAGGGAGSLGGDISTSGGTGGFCLSCSPDLHAVLDCQGNVVETCKGTDGCDLTAVQCTDACAAAVHNKQSVGCEYYSTFMDNLFKTVCFTAFIANTWNVPAHIAVEYDGQALDVGSFAYIPSGSGPDLTYTPIDAAAGIPPGEVAILFLSGPTGAKPDIPNIYCPKPSAVPSGVTFSGTGVGNSFHITSDVPVVAYQFNPYAGGGSEVTGASLLLPVSSWDTNYIAADAYGGWTPGAVAPSMNIIAAEDDTEVSMVPVVALQGSGPIPSSPANTVVKFTLNRGEHAQITQDDELTGSVIQSDKPVGLMAGHPCMYVPVNISACDHGEQMVPPVRALGSEYVGVMHRPRAGEPALWRLIGAVDGTKLTWSDDVGGPAKLNQGQVVEFLSSTPFVVNSQDQDHPFLLFSYMVSSQYVPGMGGIGDADAVIGVPTGQYMSSYVFFTDPTYPETNLVLVRKKKDGTFRDVTLDCAGVVGGWQGVGDYEWTRVDLTTGDFQPVGNCSTGRHEIRSDAPFGLWVWGWGSPMTGNPGTPSYSAWVSYGYPGGMNVQPINQVVILPEPR
ncbi:MAG: IgGFc-binding protein [Polyangiaceae bacterium]